ncbi:MAG: hypothetical protein BGN91_11225 [Nitrobacter sp. 62-13]|uniref:type I secretion C-terminal target domain-containing protein n=1 Tax=Nitrobacter sp. 62-13 TaxID=1895797 RepID=UPI0009633A93|nr:type I secretion C-terminal target domain-containing protein [Nitrobacter sp. 62-13]OJU24013.1 MAG: hypothetical protein BGN91_11225 [Nitrobacter sp. 62-13]
MSLWSSLIDIALDAAAEAAEHLPASGAGTLASQVRIFGFTATGLAAEAEAVAHDENPYVAMAAVLIGIGVVSALPEVAVATAVELGVSYSLPILGSLISEGALATIIEGVIVTGASSVIENVAEWGIDGILEEFRGQAEDAPTEFADPINLSPLPAIITGDIQPAFASAISAASPLVIDLSSAHTGVTLTSWNASTTETFFDLNANGFAVQTAWVSGDTGLLGRDLNSNGLIDSSAELFGSPTVDGFAKLAALDSNHDLRIDNNDADWSTLVVWTDDSGDAVTQTGELHSLASLGIASIDLAGVAASTSTISGNPISHTSKVTFTGGATATIADAWFIHDNTNSYYVGDYTLDVETLFLPTLRGYGTLPDLTIAMSQDSDLKDLVADFAANFTFADLASASAAIEDILFKWAGVESISATSRGSYIDAQHLGFLEHLVGTDFYQPSWHSANPQSQAAAFLEDAYQTALAHLSANLLIQVGLGELFTNPVTYNPTTGEIEGDLALSSAAIAGLATIAPSSSGPNEAFWQTLAGFVDGTKGIANLTFDEATWIDDAVTASNASLDWSAVLNSYYHDAGTNSIAGTNVADTLYGGTTNDSIDGKQGNDIIHGSFGNDTLDGSDGNDTLYGDEGNDIVRGGGGNDVLWGGDGDDKLYGQYGDDTYHPGAGGNVVYGLTGADTYYYEGGEDVYSDTGGTDVIYLPSGISLSDLSFLRVPTYDSTGNYNDLLISINGAGSIQIRNEFSSSGLGSGSIESIVFADSSTLNLTTLANPVVYLSSGNDNFSTSAPGEWTIYGGDGDDVIYSNTSASHVFDGGNGNDRLTGGSGDDTYIASAGLDSISENGGTDTIVVPVGYTIEDVEFYRIRNSNGFTNSMGVSITGLGQMVLGNHFYNNPIEYMHFLEDDSIISLTMLSIMTTGTAGNDSLSPPNNNAGLNDVLDGREGNDALYGEAGDDTYIFSDGHDKIYETSGDDTILVRDRYSPSDITIAWNYDAVNASSNNGFILTDTDGNTVIATDQSTSAGKVVEHIAFADSTIWNLDELELTLTGTSSNDNLQGRDIGDASSADTIYGLGGNDQISGNLGNDLIYGGDGNDSLYGREGDDILYGGDGADLIYASSNDGNDLQYGEGGNDTLKGADHSILYGGGGDDQLYNISTSSYAANTVVTMYGDDGADTLWAGYGQTIMHGGSGADTLVGSTGQDTFVFENATAFDAVDTLKSFNKNGGDKLDISDILDGHYDPLTQAITNFVQITTNGSNSELYVDTTGTATFGAAQHIATIQGVTGLTDEEALVTAGTLLAA